MSDLRKQALSIRLGESDIRNIKRIANRLGVRDSDIIRFAIRATLSRLAPLCDPEVRGRNLVPVLAESGDELIRYFELDAFRLGAIINDQVDPKNQVERDDIALLAMNGLREEYLHMRLDAGGEASGGVPPVRSLRRYLYDKYIYRGGDPQGRRPADSGADGVLASGGNGNGNAEAQRPASGVV